MIDFGFRVKKLHKIFARFFSSNPASGRIMEKVGMTQEGILKEHVIKEGRYEDLVHYGIVYSKKRLRAEKAANTNF